MGLATCVVLRYHGGRTSEVCELAMQHNKYCNDCALDRGIRQWQLSLCS